MYRSREPVGVSVVPTRFMIHLLDVLSVRLMVSSTDRESQGVVKDVK